MLLGSNWILLTLNELARKNKYKLISIFICAKTCRLQKMDLSARWTRVHNELAPHCAVRSGASFWPRTQRSCPLVTNWKKKVVWFGFSFLKLILTEPTERLYYRSLFLCIKFAFGWTKPYQNINWFSLIGW